MWGFVFFLISQSGTEENSCGFMLVVSCSVLGSISFRDFFIVAPAFYEVIELKKSWQKSEVAEVKPFTFFLLPLSHFRSLESSGNFTFIHTPQNLLCRAIEF